MSKASIHLMAVGDLCFGQGMREIAHRRGSAVLAELRSLIQESDLAVGNLECTLSNQGQPIPISVTQLLDGRVSRTVLMQGEPFVASILSQAGFSVLSLANNHITDFGSVAVSDTVAHLRKAGILPVGVGSTSEQAPGPVSITVNGLSVALLAFSTFASRPDSVADIHVASLSSDIVIPAVMKAKQAADCVIVSFHWGMEGQEYPFWHDVKLARATIDAGASLVFGHHPHVLQGIEQYGRGLIAYSLGNCLLDPGYTQGTNGETIILSCHLDADGVKEWTAIPLVLDADGCPVRADDASSQRILARVKELSAPLAEPSADVWRQLETVDLANQASRLWVRGWRGNLDRIRNFRLRHFRVIWQLGKLLWDRSSAPTQTQAPPEAQ